MRSCPRCLKCWCLKFGPAPATNPDDSLGLSDCSLSVATVRFSSLLIHATLCPRGELLYPHGFKLVKLLTFNRCKLFETVTFVQSPDSGLCLGHSGSIPVEKLIWRKAVLRKLFLCYSKMYHIMVQNDMNSTYRLVDFIGLWHCLV